MVEPMLYKFKNSYLNRENEICRRATVGEEGFLGDNTNSTLVLSGDDIQVEDFSSNRRKDSVRRLRMALQLGRVEDVLRRTNQITQHRDNEDSTTTHEPDEEVKGQLFAPSLTDI